MRPSHAAIDITSKDARTHAKISCHCWWLGCVCERGGEGGGGGQAQRQCGPTTTPYQLSRQNTRLQLLWVSIAPCTRCSCMCAHARHLGAHPPTLAPSALRSCAPVDWVCCFSLCTSQAAMRISSVSANTCSAPRITSGLISGGRAEVREGWWRELIRAMAYYSAWRMEDRGLGPWGQFN
jgi:hypothetical protein